MYTDQYIEYWGLIFTANQLQRRNIVFEIFLQAPCDIMQSIIFGTPMPNLTGSEHLPLMPCQQNVKDWLDRQDEIEALTAAMESLPGDHNDLVMHGEHMIEPMHRRVTPSRKKVGFGRGVAYREGC